MRENRSEVAHFRQQQALEEEAAQQGLTGLAAVAKHAAITARMEKGAERVLRLVRAGKQEEAKILLFSDHLWTDEGENA